jgi:periplasmic copper chaperone A
MKTLFRHPAALLGLLFALSSSAQTGSTGVASITDVWARGTVQGQKATGVFATLKSTAGAKLIAAESSVAGVVEVHEMKMEGDVMKMRRVNAVDLPPGQAVALTPGGLHVMLMDLKQPLKEGELVPVTFVVEGRDGKKDRVSVLATVKPLGAGASKDHPHHGSGHKH